jgi:hypothetical protein
MLMDMVLTKYSQIKQEKNCKAKSPEQEQIVVLIAQLQRAQAKDESKTTGSKSASKGSSKDARESKKGKSCTRKYPDWRYERNGQDKTMEKGGKTWYWCDHHQMWCEHITEDCRAKKALDGGKSVTNKEKPNKTKDGGQTDTLSIAKALVAITETEDYASDNNDEL